jgi:hypothetical protein
MKQDKAPARVEATSKIETKAEMDAADIEFVSQIAEVLGLNSRQAISFCGQVQSFAKEPIPLAYIAAAVQKKQRTGKTLSVGDVAKLAAQLHNKAMKQMGKNRIEEMKEKDARVHKMQPFPEQAAPEYVLDESGFIIKNPELPEDDKSD